MSGIIWKIILLGIFYVVAVFGFIYFLVPKLDSPTVSALAGIAIGSLAAILGPILNTLVSIWNRSKESEERLKDRVSNHALELTKMDYDLRQKSLETSGKTQEFLAPAKVYRTFYKALLELHTTGNWPKEVEDLGLLQIFELGKKN